MYLLYLLLIGAGVLSLLGLTVIASNQNTLNLKKIVCTPLDKEVFINMSCSLKPINRYKTIANMAGLVSRPIDDIMVHLKIYKKFNLVYKPFLVDVNENLCDALAKKSGATYLKLFLALMGSYTNLNHTCPYEGWIQADDIQLDMSKLNVFVPQGDYRVDVMPSEKKDPHDLFLIQVYAEVGEKNSAKGK